jgi:hypothetical protein
MAGWYLAGMRLVMLPGNHDELSAMKSIVTATGAEEVSGPIDPSNRSARWDRRSLYLR